MVWEAWGSKGLVVSFLVYGDIYVMSYSLFEGFVSGQVPDQTTKYGCIESVVAIVMGCFATHFCTSHCIWYTGTLALHFRMCTPAYMWHLVVKVRGQGPRVQGDPCYVAFVVFLVSLPTCVLHSLARCVHCPSPHYG